MQDNLTIGKKIEDYARKNIPESKKEFGEFMYHAELIKRGHWNVHYFDLEDMNESYQEIIKDICTHEDDGSLFSMLDKDLGRYL